MTETNKPTFVFEGTELLAHALHAQLLARRRGTFEHDIKNVIHGLLSGTELLSKALATNSPRIPPAQCLSLLQQQLGRAQSTLHRMLDEIASDAGPPSSISLQDLVEECAHDLRHQLQRFDWHTSIDSQLKVQANRSRLKDALLGVLLEAIDRSPLHSAIAAAAELDGGSVRLTFTHTSDRTDRDQEPSLATILQAEGATIGVSSSATQRSVTIGLRSPDPTHASSGTDGLIIVDANRDAADSLAMLVQLEGFEAIATYDVDSALLAAQSNRPRAMIVDLDGSIDSTALISKLRTAGVSGQIIGLSHGGNARSTDIDAQLRKPLDPHSLRSLLQPT